MKKIAFKMKLNPGCREEYKRRHDNIWPELAGLLSKNGIKDYSIFLDEETNTLFAVLYQNENAASGKLEDDPIMRKWWEYMSDIMETNPDQSPVSIPLVKVFHME